mmetsp:Transcript_28293/g.56988  ORF Transcript_28293/g.56988 Transcript_28293/m.56988 type:complete len:537 (-) Transcript_28293:209-1819(-)
MARVNEEYDDDDDLEAVDIEDGVDERPSHQRRGEILDEDNRTHPWDSTSDCFDDFDGRAVVEPDDVKARRLAGQSSARDQLKAFDSRAVFYSTLFLFEWLLFLFSFPLFLAFCLVVVGPLCVFYQWWKLHQKECTLPTVIHAVGRGFYDVTLMMICASYGALIIGLIVLFWFYDAGAFKNSSEGAVVFTFYTFVILPFVASEEALKGMFVRMQHKKVQLAQAARTNANGEGGSGSGRMVDEMTRQHLIHSTATSAGYALSQAMGWVVIAHLVVSSNSADYASSMGDQVALCLVVGVMVTVFGTPLQLLSGYLIGLEVTREKWSNCGTSLLVPMALRSVYYISAVGFVLIVPSLVGALALFMLTNLAVSGLLLYRVKCVERLMPAAYLRRVGYLTWGGYGVLDLADDDGDDGGDDGEGVQAGVHDEPPLQQRLTFPPVASQIPRHSSNNTAAEDQDGGGVEMQQASEGGGGSVKVPRYSQGVDEGGGNETAQQALAPHSESSGVVQNPIVPSSQGVGDSEMGYGSPDGDDDDEIAVL